MKRTASAMIVAVIMAFALPQITVASSSPTLSLTRVASSGQSTLTFQLSGRGFSSRERLTIAYRVILAGSSRPMKWTRVAQADMFGRFVRPPLGVAVEKARQAYQVTASVTGEQGNRAETSVRGVFVQPVSSGKRIVVSISTQTLSAYQNGRLVLRSLVSTGNRATPTPLGSYRIFAKHTPYRFVSPWPLGHPYWYAPAWTSYAMEFIQGGYFIHDAPWRSVFGPGSNGAGQPGTNYGGTHGCVNAPVSAAQFVYTWAPVGTRVDVVP